MDKETGNENVSRAHPVINRNGISSSLLIGHTYYVRQVRYYIRVNVVITMKQMGNIRPATVSNVGQLLCQMPASYWPVTVPNAGQFTMPNAGQLLCQTLPVTM